MLTLNRATPTMYVRNMDSALSFYRDMLGFSVVFTNGQPVSLAVLQRDTIHLHLSVHADRAGLCHAHIMVSDLDALYALLLAAETNILQPPKVQPWGLRDIVVADPDGNTFEFAETTHQ